VRVVGSKTPKQERNNLTKMKTALAAFCVCTAVAAPASAQQMQWTDKGFVKANVGVQVGSHDFNSTQTFTIYDENGSINSSQKVKSGGYFDVGFGYKVWHNVTVGATYSWMTSDSNVTVNASVPDPIFFDRPRAVSTSVSNADHRENALHFDATWMMPVTDKIDVGFSAGPSIFFVKQDLVTSLVVTEPGPSVTAAPFNEEKDSAFGLNFGVDATYLLNKKWGIGGDLRYTWGSVKLSDASDDLTVGGLQLGVGVRMRF
jgi:hypothetical protein